MQNKKTLLIVDDDPQIRKYLYLLFKKEKIAVMEAADGNECIALCEKCRPSVLLIDIVMPEKDGVTTIQEVKSRYGKTKIIAISGGYVFNAETYLDEAKNVGADAVFTKPLNRSALVSTVRRYMV